MQSSGISSRATPSASQSPAGLTRRRFALKGVSVAIDLRTDAVRGDLADVRLADRVFAPHYAAPMPRVLASDAVLRSARPKDAEPVADLHAGDIFEILELSGGSAWGVAPGVGLVGYVDAAAIGESAA